MKSLLTTLLLIPSLAAAQNNTLEMNNALMTFPNAQRITLYDDAADFIKCGFVTGYVIQPNGDIVDFFCSIVKPEPCVSVESGSVRCGLVVL